MNLSAPTTMVFMISIILAALAVIGKFVAIPIISDNGFWVAIIAYAILAIGNLFRGV
jgi:hypothetical protein